MIEMDYSYAYMKMLLALFVIVIFLYLVKKYIEKKNLLFTNQKNDIKILSQKFIDTKNKITLIKYKDKEYLLYIGENSFLIDKFDNFETILQKKQDNIDEDIDNN